jgi:hypothetical protein
MFKQLMLHWILLSKDCHIKIDNICTKTENSGSGKHLAYHDTAVITAVKSFVLQAAPNF